MMRSYLGRVAWALLLGSALVLPAFDALAAPQTANQEQEEQERQNLEEVVVVTASRTQELLLEAPTSISVVDSADIALSPAQNYADLLRGIPGLNVVQTSARDMNMSSRSTTGTLDASQLVLIDGRSVYQDFFGFVAWDLLPLDFSEIEQIEVTRGPASAVWGANAMTGVVNIITKSPFSLGNAFRVRTGGGERGTGFGSLTYSGVRDRLAYRLTAGYMTQNAWDRPGPLENGIARDGFPNGGTKQPKFDGRLDITSGDDAFWTFSGGYAGTGGTIHTGIGPFSIRDDTTFWYVRSDYNLNAFNVTAYANILDGDAVNLLNGLPFSFESQTYHLQANNTSTFGRHAATYGANIRTINFDLSIAPGEDKRSEGGAFATLDLNLNDSIALDAGIRGDTFSTIDGSVWSPRAALLVRPDGTSSHVLRASFGRAYRAPSLINNFLDVTIFNVAPLPTGPFVFASGVFGNPDLTEERLDQIEFGYRGSAMDGKISWDMSVYRTSNKDSIDFYTSGVYTAFNPPPGWPLPVFLLPPLGPVLLPSTFSYRNIGEIVNKGFEVGVKIEPAARNTLFVNYSFQNNPEVTGIDATEIGVPAEHKFNVAWNGYSGPLYYSSSVNYVGDAYWADVLDSRFFGTTESYTTLDASLGYMFLDGRLEASLRATNLTNVAMLQHIFGDIIGRRVIAEVSLNVR